jgi:LmbE family N-acetylglucosaminyl deacetylase
MVNWSAIYILRSIPEKLLPINYKKCLMNMRKSLLGVAVVVVLLSTSFAQAPTSNSTPNQAARSSAPGYLDPLPQDTGTAGLKQQLRKLQTTGRLMMVVAHPDDEDGGLLTLEARGKGVQTLLFTLTRGEGGQNKLGSSLFDVLGVLRTLELLASDRYYGVEQRFSRVADFGYSKTADETFQKWGGHDVPLADIVRVVRTFRPDVLIARFSGTENDGHGHHQASAILTREAFRAAADPNRFPEQIKEGLQPWQPKKLYIGNVCGFGATSCPDENWTVKLNTGEEDPALGMSYVQFAIEGLRHQQSQGLGDLKVPAGPRYAFYKLADSVVPNTKDASGHEKDLFDGIDTSLRGLAVKVGVDENKAVWLSREMPRINQDIEEVNKNESGTAVEPLLDAASRFHSLILAADNSDLPTPRKNALVTELTAKQSNVNAALNLALRISADAIVDGPNAVSPGEQLKYRARFHNGSQHDLQASYGGPLPQLDFPRGTRAVHVRPGQEDSKESSLRVPEHFNRMYTRPYWHRQNPETDSVNIIDDPRFATLPLPPFPFSEDVAYSLKDQAMPRNDAHPGQQPRISAPLTAELRMESGKSAKEQVSIVPQFSIALEPGEQVIPVTDGESTTVKIGVSSNLAGTPSGTLRLELPSGWRAEPDNLKVSLPKRGDKQDFEFKVFPANLKEARAQIRAVLDADGEKYTEGYTLVTREDLGSFYYFQPALQRISIVDVKLPEDLKVGYIMGAGDDIPIVLQQIGMNVTLIPAEKLGADDLSKYGTIVLGVRAYDTQKEIAANNQKLLDFVRNGGTLIVQNNNSVSDFNSGRFTPYPAELGRARVSVEEAPVQILAPDNPIFHYPNEISTKDFDGWVQERGLYFMSSWDDHFTPLLSCHDPNESDQKGGLLLAKYGKGTYIYTGYAFFRQLPAGVPGAVRLFVNLVSAGSAASSH